MKHSNNNKMEVILTSKESLLNELTKMDIVMYRKRGLADIGKYAHEPPGFRVKLYDIYSKLSLEDLQVMYDMKRERYQIKK
jgi:hypothetical protein